MDNGEPKQDFESKVRSIYSQEEIDAICNKELLVKTDYSYIDNLEREIQIRFRPVDPFLEKHYSAKIKEFGNLLFNR